MRRERVAVLCVAAVLIIVRTAVFLFFEGSFNSDQAVTGLMTTHLIEGRAFPVFKYGQDYQLAVQVWMAAPLFMLFGPSEPWRPARACLRCTSAAISRRPARGYVSLSHQGARHESRSHPHVW